MKISRSPLILKTLKARPLIFCLGIILVILLLSPDRGFSRIFIDINAPSIQKIKIAIPDFENIANDRKYQELSTSLPEVISNDLDLSGYFTPIEKEAFLTSGIPSQDMGKILFKNWSVIGAELLLIGRFTCIGQSVELEIRLYDVFWGRQIMGRRVLGKIEKSRYLMHRVGNEIISLLTGHKGMFLTKLAFVSTATGHKEIYISDYDGHNVRQITNDRSIALFPRWSPLGDKIIYNSYKDQGTMLYVKDMATGGGKRVSGRKGLNIGACWGSDGQKLALTLSHKGNPDIYLIDLNGRIIDRLTNHWGIDVSPSFSPDGDKMAFVSNRSGSPQIYVRDLVNGGEQRLTFEGKYNTSPQWSKLDRITFSGLNDGSFDIFTINPDGRQLRRLTQDQGKNEDPCWSPDGRYIMFSSNRSGRYHLYIMNASGQNQRKITFLKGEQSSPSWSN